MIDEKQIEEMAKDLQGEDYAVVIVQGKTTSLSNQTKKYLRQLIDKGYRKINENEVVISKEEYEKLKRFEKKVRSGVCFTQKEWFDYANEDSNYRTSLQIKAKEQARKETAEKIFDILYQWLDLEEIEKYGFVTIQKFDFLRKFREIYKQFGVDLGETK